MGVNKNNGKVTSTNPYGSLSYNLMVVNTCGMPETFDANVALAPSFSTQPNNNKDAGNAVFTFATAGEIDPTLFAIGSFGPGHRKVRLFVSRTSGAGRLDVPRNGSHEHQ